MNMRHLKCRKTGPLHLNATAPFSLISKIFNSEKIKIPIQHRTCIGIFTIISNTKNTKSLFFKTEKPVNGNIKYFGKSNKLIIIDASYLTFKL